jgi:flagellar motor switch/type III secretory pathway protein FliN
VSDEARGHYVSQRDAAGGREASGPRPAAAEPALRVRLGQRWLTPEAVEALRVGSVLALCEAAGDPVEVLARGRPVARGTAVTVDGRFGVCVKESLSGRT